MNLFYADPLSSLPFKYTLNYFFIIGRGNIKDIKFSPGRGNMKILVLHSSGVAVWDVKELELINELRVGPDIVGVVCVDWAASDRVMLLCQDGSVRVMGLALAGSSSPALLYHRQHPLR